MEVLSMQASWKFHPLKSQGSAIYGSSIKVARKSHGNPMEVHASLMEVFCKSQRESILSPMRSFMRIAMDVL